MQVLKSKYNCGNATLRIVVKRRNPSNLWKGVCNSWAVVKSHICWVIGDGCTVRFWLDNWLVSFNNLSAFAVRVLSNNEQKHRVCDFTDRWGCWDNAKLRHYLLGVIVNHIMTVVPPNPNRGKDVMA